jgi:hypothetical protein
MINIPKSGGNFILAQTEPSHKAHRQITAKEVKKSITVLLSGQTKKPMSRDNIAEVISF